MLEAVAINHGVSWLRRERERERVETDKTKIATHSATIFLMTTRYTKRMTKMTKRER